MSRVILTLRVESSKARDEHQRTLPHGLTTLFLHSIYSALKMLLDFAIGKALNCLNAAIGKALNCTASTWMFEDVARPDKGGQQLGQRMRQPRSHALYPRTHPLGIDNRSTRHASSISNKNSCLISPSRNQVITPQSRFAKFGWYRRRRYGCWRRCCRP